MSLWNDLDDPVFDGVGLVGFKSRADTFLLAELLASFLFFYCFPFFVLPSVGWYCGAGVFGLIGQ